MLRKVLTFLRLALWWSPEAWISRYFRAWEWVKWSPREKPPMRHIWNMVKLSNNLMDVIRERAGLPVVITKHGGWRDSYANSVLTNGAPGSQHLKGRACDFRIQGFSGRELHAFVNQLYQEGAVHFGGSGLYVNRDYTHVDIGPSRKDGSPRRWQG